MFGTEQNDMTQEDREALILLVDTIDEALRREREQAAGDLAAEDGAA